jgi:hypothetical protein
MRSSQSTDISFLDILFNMVLLFLILFVLSFINMNKDKKSDANMETKCEMLITLTWDSKCGADIDLYCKDPLDNIVFFSSRENGLMYLNRDDLGTINDKITLPDGSTKTYNENREVISLKGLLDGTYIVNTHYYSPHTWKGPVDVTVKVEKINPSIQILWVGTKTLEVTGDEKTMVQFTLADGKLVETNELQEKFTEISK